MDYTIRVEVLVSLNYNHGGGGTEYMPYYDKPWAIVVNAKSENEALKDAKALLDPLYNGLTREESCPKNGLYKVFVFKLKVISKETYGQALISQTAPRNKIDRIVDSDIRALATALYDRYNLHQLQEFKRRKRRPEPLIDLCNKYSVEVKKDWRRALSAALRQKEADVEMTKTYS
jgi:hypothetical protein